jgi:hypothetical protein
MSILPLSFFSSLAIDMMSVPFQVDDYAYEAVDGIDREVFIETRDIEGAVDTGGRRTLVQVFGESATDGDIGIYLKIDTPLYFLDTEALEEAGDVRKQSFVRYGGYEYRVLAVADYRAQGNSRMYLASRHIAQDRPI